MVGDTMFHRAEIRRAYCVGASSAEPAACQSGIHARDGQNLQSRMEEGGNCRLPKNLLSSMAEGPKTYPGIHIKCDGTEQLRRAVEVWSPFFVSTLKRSALGV